jgi:hypothetical protein
MINSIRVKALRFIYGSILEVVGVLKAWLLGKKGLSGVGLRVAMVLKRNPRGALETQLDGRSEQRVRSVLATLFTSSALLR